MPLDDRAILVRCPLFAQLGGPEIEALAAVAQRRRYEAGETLFMAGDPPEGLHVVVSGAVKIFILSPQSGREMILTSEHPYQTVAELPSFDRGVYPANAEAVQETETLFLELGSFETVLKENPQIALHLLRTLGRRLRRLVSLIEQVSFQEVVHRLATYLLTQAGTGAGFELATNAQIAAQLGTVPELVSRNLARLHQSGAVQLEGRRVVRLDRQALEELAESAGR